jgi:hypothetical protein
MRKHSPTEPQSWLEQAYPQMHFLLLALDGDKFASRWLADNSHGVALLTRALSGDQAVLETLDKKSDDLDDLFELIDNEDLVDWLAQRQPELHLLFEAIQGNDHAVALLKRRKPTFACLVKPFRRVHEAFLQKSLLGNGQIEGGAVADMSCLIGEMHLRQGEYEKAVAAFSRAIETRPAPDLFEGRARAYRALAERDESRARGMS